MAGWLDNFGKDDNYNDYQTHVPQGFEGDGFSNVGRNYSPAWGGQFQMGGNIYPVNYVPQAQDGLQTVNSRQKRGLDLLIKETKKAKEDEKELHNTGQVKYPKSIKYKKQKKELDKKQTYLTQDNRSEAVKNYDEAKGREKEFKKTIKPVIQAADLTTDLMQLGNFVPHPIGQAIGEVGNIAGAGIDAYQAADEYSEGNYDTAAINAGSAILPNLLEVGSFARNSKYLRPGEVMYPLSPQAFGSPARTKYLELFNTTRGSNAFKTNVNRSLLGTLGAESVYDIPDFQTGGKLTFLQPTSDKLPEGYMKGSSIPSTERAMSIGGENGEPAYLIPSFKYGQELLGPVFDPISEFKRTGEHLGGPFKTWQEAEEWEENVRHPAVENRETIMFPQEKFQTGGSMPGATGSMYARIGAPSKGPKRNQTDVTDASAQNGQEMKYYQNELDWKPKTISQEGSIIKDDRGQWDHPGEITRIKGGNITMKKDPKTGKALAEPLLGIADTGEEQWMYPGKDYNFDGANYVTEIPKSKLAKNGIRQEQKGLQNLDNLVNFTNYNKPTVGGWLNKYN